MNVLIKTKMEKAQQEEQNILRINSIYAIKELVDKLGDVPRNLTDEEFRQEYLSIIDETRKVIENISATVKNPVTAKWKFFID